VGKGDRSGGESVSEVVGKERDNSCGKGEEKGGERVIEVVGRV
jgi:hypothetical protein